ncbi:hypothetical protein Goari_013180 [Gossypium aridum]|uniref:Uncharacterized protein n=1 Tax=Gossypium aridum TaxID=34290 RepID=A0A7J8XF36_GOSAI|nr:hypothetical protein [Gossypium aridum]
MEADKTISPSSDRVNREGLQGPREDNSSRPVGTEGGDLNKNTVGFCSILQERCVIHAAWFSTAGKSFGAFFALGTCNPCLIACKSTLICLGSLVETHSILEAGCVVPPGQRIPSGALGAGNPAEYTKKH